jgi:limonene 1,2-monooxygenase
VVTLAHVARSREQARENVKHGLDGWAQYFRDIATFPIVPPEIDNAYEYLTDNSMAVIGDPDDAIRHIEKLLKGSGGFGTYLELAHNWADFDATLEHYELMARYVVPHFNGKNRLRQVSYDYSHANREVFVGQAQAAVETEIQRQADKESGRKAQAGDD